MIEVQRKERKGAFLFIEFPQSTYAYFTFLVYILQQARFQAMSDAIITKIDEMGGRIDELEKNISELMSGMGHGGK